MLKCQFHSHAYGDPVDNISYSPKALIDEAAKLKYDVLSITCHRKILHTKNLETYARKKGILLIPGIEFEIGKKHILCINAHEDIYKVQNFENLKEYREKHPECLIIAAHPYFPGPGLKRKLEQNLELFDAIEISWAYTKHIDFNKKIYKLNKPLIATADCHILKNLNTGYCLIDSPKDISRIFKAIKSAQIQNHHSPSSIFKILHSLICTITKPPL